MSKLKNLLEELIQAKILKIIAMTIIGVFAIVITDNMIDDYQLKMFIIFLIANISSVYMGFLYGIQQGRYEVYDELDNLSVDKTKKKSKNINS